MEGWLLPTRCINAQTDEEADIRIIKEKPFTLFEREWLTNITYRYLYKSTTFIAAPLTLTNIMDPSAIRVSLYTYIGHSLGHHRRMAGLQLTEADLWSGMSAIGASSDQLCPPVGNQNKNSKKACNCTYFASRRHNYIF